MGRNGRIAMLAAAVLAALSPACVAHKPLSIGGIFDTQTASLRLDNVDVSQGVYAELTREHDRLWLTFDGTEAEVLHVSLGVPILARLSAHRPSLAVVGPGLPAAQLPLLYRRGTVR